MTESFKRGDSTRLISCKLWQVESKLHNSFLIGIIFDKHVHAHVHLSCHMQDEAKHTHYTVFYNKIFFTYLRLHGRLANYVNVSLVGLASHGHNAKRKGMAHKIQIFLFMLTQAVFYYVFMKCVHIVIMINPLFISMIFYTPGVHGCTF